MIGAQKAITAPDQTNDIGTGVCRLAWGFRDASEDRGDGVGGGDRDEEADDDGDAAGGGGMRTAGGAELSAPP